MSVLLQDLLARAADSRPGATAVVDGGTRFIYSEIATASRRLAATLVRHGVEPGDRVGVLVRTQAEAVIAIHAVLTAGAAYVPLDPDGPADHLARVLCCTRPRLLVAVPAAGARLAELAAGVSVPLPLPPVGSLTTAPVTDLGGRAMSAFTRVEWDTPAPSPARRGVDTDPACLLFDPGLAAHPRGVVVTHREALASVGWAVRELGIRACDRLSGHAPPHTGLAAFDMFGAFAAGAELHLVPHTLDRDLRRLVELVRDHELTQWSSAPALLSYVARFDALRPGELPALARIAWCGGAPPAATLSYWTRRVPHVRFTRLHGVPCEAVGPTDLGVVERVLNTVEHVCESAVVAVDTGVGESSAIGAAYVTSNGLTPPKLRRALTASVPAHLLPQRWMALDALPRTDDGTIDRRALRAGFAEPGTPGRRT
jgi:acyl-coenzyme A synthetase/AMP-(fatty) acid ligase